jgi:hypothetical protein
LSPTPTSDNRDALREALSTIAIASSIAACAIATVYWLARTGFPNPLEPVLKCVGLALIFTNVPYLIWRGINNGQQTWTRSYSLVWMLVFAGVALLGRIQVDVGYSFALLLTIGVLAFLVVLRDWLRFVSIRYALLLIIGSGYFGVWAAGVVWGRIYKTPVFLETMIATGIVHHDGLGLAAMGSMLRTYHIASVGLDGLPYVGYHWGTPWLFAQFGNLTDVTVFDFYQLGYPVTMIPLFFGSVLSFGAVLRERFAPGVVATRDWLYWLIFVAATIGIMPVTGTDAVGIWTSNVTISESYSVAVACALMLLATAMFFWIERRDAIIGGSRRVSDYVFIVAVLMPGLVLLSYLKISLMVLGFVAVVVVAFRHRLLFRPRTGALVLLGAAALFVAYQRTNMSAHNEGVHFLDYLQSYVPRVWWPFFVLFQLFWPLLYIVLRLRRENARTIADLRRLIKERRIVDLEVLATVAVIGILPGVFLHIDGGSAFYFADVQRWVGVGLLIASLPLLVKLPRLKFSDLRMIAIVLIAIPLAVTTFRNSWYWTATMLRANADLRTTLYSYAGVKAPQGIRALRQLADPAVLRAGLVHSPNYNAVRGLIDVQATPLEVKRETALFIPQSDTAYWHILRRSNSCSFSGHLAPSITGMSLVDGMPPYGCALSPYYGLSLYTRRDHPQTPQETDPAAVCARARRLGFKRVMTLRFDSLGQTSKELMSCTT